MMVKLSHCCFALIVACFPIYAANNSPPLDLNKPASEVRGQLTRIDKDLGAGEIYSEISYEQRSLVKEALVRIESSLERSGGRTLSVQEQPEVFNDQERVNTILTQVREDSRMICRREKTIGSHRVTSQCMTVAARRRAQEKGEGDMVDMQRRFNAVRPND